MNILRIYTITFFEAFLVLLLIDQLNFQLLLTCCLSAVVVVVFYASSNKYFHSNHLILIELYWIWIIDEVQRIKIEHQGYTTIMRLHRIKLIYCGIYTLIKRNKVMYGIFRRIWARCFGSNDIRFSCKIW